MHTEKLVWKWLRRVYMLWADAVSDSDYCTMMPRCAQRGKRSAV